MYHWKILCDGIVIIGQGVNGTYYSNMPLVNNVKGQTQFGTRKNPRKALDKFGARMVEVGYKERFRYV